MIRASNLGALRSLLQAQGHQYLDATVCDLYLRQAVDEFVGDHPWPWRRVTVLGEEGSEFAGIDIVDQVSGSSGATLQMAKVDAMRDKYGGTLDTTGPPFYWYEVDDRILTYPRSLDEIAVTFYTSYGWVDSSGLEYKARPTQDTDTPICPARCEEIVLLGARVRAKGEAQDFEQGAALREQYETRIEEERSRPDQVDEFETIRVTAEEWA